jgi:hypothetical protein
MSRVVIVARTRMQHGHLCIGAHDLNNGFHGLRLLDKFGDHWPAEAPFQVGGLWRIRYRPKVSARPPHVEDVFVLEQEQLGTVPDLKALVLARVRPWEGGPDALYGGTLRATSHGGGHIPVNGRVPRCSTGYWLPDHDLERAWLNGRARFHWTGDGTITRFAWVGTQEPPERIGAGSLVRVSLSRAFKAEGVPEGYYLQLSGVL